MHGFLSADFVEVFAIILYTFILVIVNPEGFYIIIEKPNLGATLYRLQLLQYDAIQTMKKKRSDVSRPP